MIHSTMRKAMQSGKTLVFGHRGAMAAAPMNTLAAFQLAYEQAANGIELDVQLSKDGRLIVLHDFTVDETTDGQGNAADFTLAELKQLDAGSWFSPEFSGERIPTLDEVFAAFGEKLLINVEIKSRFDSRDNGEALVATCIRRHQMADRVIVSSFDPEVLARFKSLCPDVMLGYLYLPTSPPELLETVYHDARHPWHDVIDEAYMALSKAKGLFVNAWTVNDPQRAIALSRLGVNGVITDDPAGIAAALASC